MECLTESRLELVIQTIKGVNQDFLPNFNDQTVKNLAKSTNSFLLKLIKNSMKMAIIEKRENLRVVDIESTMDIFSIQPMILTSKKNFLKKCLETERETRKKEIFRTPKIFEEVLDIQKPRPLLLSVHWLAIDGIQPKIAQNPLKSGNSRRRLLSNNSGVVSNNSIDVEIRPVSKNMMSKEQKEYFIKVCLVFSMKEYKKKELIVKSIREDKGNEQLIPFFIKYVSKKIAKNFQSNESMSTAIDFVHAIAFSNNTNVSHYMDKVITMLLFSTLKVDLGKNSMGNYPIRENGAVVLALVCEKFKELDLSSKITNSVIKKLFLNKKGLTLPSIFGAVSILAFLDVSYENRVLVEGIIELTFKMHELINNGNEIKSKWTIRKGLEEVEASYVLSTLIPVVTKIFESFYDELKIKKISELDEERILRMGKLRSLLGENLLVPTRELTEFFI